MKLGGQRSLARELDCSASFINGLFKKNDPRIVKVGSKIDLDKSIEKFANSNFGKKQKVAREAAQRVKKRKTKSKIKNIDNAVALPKTGETIPELSEESTRDELEKVKIFEQTRKLKLESDIKEGMLLDRQETKDELFKIFRITRDAIQSIPARVSGRLVGLEQFDIEMILKAEIDSALNNLVNHF
jgi:hypothetical protein